MASNIPADLRYTKDHEWAKLDGDIITVGITDFAQSSLGDIVFVELPDADTELDKEATFGVVESIKSVSDLYSPVSGVVVEKNADVESSPELLNSDPYANWMIKIKVSDVSVFDSLLSASDYENCCQ